MRNGSNYTVYLAKPFVKVKKEELVKRFGPEIDPGEFPPAFEVCIKLIAELKRTGSVAGVKTPRKGPEAEEGKCRCRYPHA